MDWPAEARSSTMQTPRLHWQDFHQDERLSDQVSYAGTSPTRRKTRRASEQRPHKVRSNVEDDHNKKRMPASFKPVTNDGMTTKLAELIAFFTSSTTETVACGFLKLAFETNMKFKLQRYTSLLLQQDIDVERERSVAASQQQTLQNAARVSDEGNRWSIFEKVGTAFINADTAAAATRNMIERISANLQGAGVGNGKPPVRGDDIWERRDHLVDALRELTNFASQPHIIDSAVDIVTSFLKNPAIVRQKFLNFIMVGSAGVGKSTLVKAVAKVFAACGLFVGDQVKTAGRAEFIGEYEGQTVARTRSFLISQLDQGVIFVDEAYAISPWNDGKPEGYGSEAISAINEFMTQYKGLYCFMAAGYEKEIRRYFLPVNPGFERRFTYTYTLNDLSVDDLIFIFKKTLIQEMGGRVKPGRTDSVVKMGTDMFTSDAWEYMRELLSVCRTGQRSPPHSEYDAATRQTYENVTTFTPQYPNLYKRLVENQAGSMTNLAEEAANLLVSDVPLSVVATFRKKHKDLEGATMPAIERQDTETLQRIIVQRLENSALSDWPSLRGELREAHNEIGVDEPEF